MSNENLPLEGGSLIDAIREFNLPNLIAGPAGKAISRLIAGAADIPAAFLEGISQGIRDKKEAKTLISKELAKAVAENAKLDIETVNRAAVRWLGDEVRKQVNREEVARKTIDYLKDSPVEESTPVVDDDFMDSFSSYAEKANSEKMRDLWARVLKGEIRKPGSYSLATLRFMAELDIETANAVQEIFIGVFRGGAIFWQEDFNKSPKLTSVTLLEQRGLLSGVGGMRSTYPEIESNGYLILPFRKKGLVLTGKPSTKIGITSLLLSRMGVEVMSLLDLEDDLEIAQRMLPELTLDGVDKIEWCDCLFENDRLQALQGGTTIWERPQVNLG